MNNKSLSIAIVLFLLATQLVEAQINLNWQSRQDLNENLPPEIQVYETTSQLNGRPFYALYAAVDITSTNLDIVPAYSQDGYQTPSEFEAQHDREVYLTINGGFFGNNTSYSLLINNFDLLAKNILAVSRTSTADNQAHDYYPTRGAFGINASASPDVAWVYTPDQTTYYYPSPSPNTITELPQPQPGASFPSGGAIWDVEDAIGGGPVLISDGNVVLGNQTPANPELFPGDIMDSQAPRTAIGYRQDGTMILFVCDGRQDHSQGATLNEVAQILNELNCYEALNLDGGGSSVFQVNNQIQNKPSDGTVRPVPTVLMVASENRSDVPTPKGEMRSAWIATVSNLDWPPASTRNNVEAQKTALISLLDSLQDINLNAVFFQVRTEGDAFYQSAYEPWSRYLTGVQGTDPGYDPLAFALEEAHKRGMELHAWLNPYRVNVSTADGAGYYAPEHVYIEHPEWILEYTDVERDGKKILNPGLPAVQNYIKEVVGDILSKYDVDGIHFDDYFYAYGGTPSSLDQATYNEYGAEYANIGDFRRASINKMIAGVYDTVQSVRPYVRFGVSPFGIYGNGMNPEGIIGMDAYNEIYSDPLAWLQQGTVDYINPQLYWPTGGAQDFNALLSWWAEKANTYGRQLYAGHGIYRLNNFPDVARKNLSDPIHEDKLYFNLSYLEQGLRTMADAWTLEQIVTQVEIVRQHADQNALGSVFFRALDFERVYGLKEHLKNRVYFEQALVPEMSWDAKTVPLSPNNVRLEKLEGDAFFSLVWDHNQDSIRYAIYSFDTNTSAGNFTSQGNLEAVTYNKYLALTNNSIPEGNVLVVTALDRYGQESAASEVYGAPQPAQVTLSSPADGTLNVPNNIFLNWNSAEFANSYQLVLARDQEFNDVIYDNVVQDTFIYIVNLPLTGEESYFWKVAGKNIAGTGAYSNIWNFSTGYPAIPLVTNPEPNATEVALQPVIEWQASEAAQEIEIQVSEGGTGFIEQNMVINTIVQVTESTWQTQDPLSEFTTHYLRLRARNNYGTSDWTPVVQFKTLKPAPPPPAITSPENQAESVPLDGIITWTNVAEATSYQFQMSENENFDPVLIDQRVYGTESFTYQNLEEGKTYFIRVAGRNAGGLGEWSEVVSFVTEIITSIDDPGKKETIGKVYPNPSQGILNLDISLQRKSTISLKLLDMSGREILSRSFQRMPGNGNIQIETKEIDCYPCLLEILIEGNREVKKIWIMR